MSDYMHTGLELVGKHIPDSSIESDADGNKTRVALPGKYQVGTVIEGVFVPLLERKAAGLFADIERHKQSQSQEGETQPQSGE